MQVQAQLRRIKELADNSTLRRRYARLGKAVDIIERGRGYKVYNTDGYSVLTDKQSDRVEKTVTHSGRVNAIRRAASGQSAG